MFSLFSRNKASQEEKRLATSIEQLESEQVALKESEKLLLSEVRKSAEDGDLAGMKITARDVVRTRRNIQLLSNHLSNLHSALQKIQAKKSNKSAGDGKPTANMNQENKR